MKINSVSFYGKHSVVQSIAKKAPRQGQKPLLCAFSINPRYEGQTTPQKLSQWMNTFREAEARGAYKELTVL